MTQKIETEWILTDESFPDQAMNRLAGRPGCKHLFCHEHWGAEIHCEDCGAVWKRTLQLSDSEVARSKILPPKRLYELTMR